MPDDLTRILMQVAAGGVLTGAGLAWLVACAAVRRARECRWDAEADLRATTQLNRHLVALLPAPEADRMRVFEAIQRKRGNRHADQ